MNKIAALSMVFMLLLSASPLLIQKSTSQITRPSDLETATIFNELEYVWYGNFVVNATDTVSIENCNFTVESGSVIIYGELNISNSNFIIHYPTAYQKTMVVYGNFTASNSTFAPAILMDCYAGAGNVSMYDSISSMTFMCYGGTISIVNSLFARLWLLDGIRIEMTNSNASLCVVQYDNQEMSFVAVDSDINYMVVYGWTGDFEVQTGLNENLSLVSELLRITLLDSLVEGWDVSFNGSGRILNSEIDSLEGLEISTNWTGPITLTPGYIENEEFAWCNYPLTIENSTIANYGIEAPTNASLQIVNSDVQYLAGDEDCNITVENSKITQIYWMESGTVLTVNSTIDNFFIISRSCFLNLTLIDGFYENSQVFGEESPMHLTLLNSTVNTWEVSLASGTLELHDSNLNGFSYDFGDGLHNYPIVYLQGNAQCEIYNSTVEVIRCTGSANLTLVDSFVDSAYVYDDAGVTAVNSTIETVVTDPLPIKSQGSLIMLFLNFAFQFDEKDVNASFSEDTNVPLPTSAEPFSSFVNVTTSYGNDFAAQVKLYYNKTQVLAAGIREERLQIYFLDDSDTWRPCPVQGVDTDENYVWANVTSLSSFVVVYGGPVHDLAIVDVESQKSIIPENLVIPVNATVANIGDYDEQLNVTCYLNETVLETRSLSLSSMESTSLLFDLNTTAIPKGRYALTVQVSPVENETHLEDNTFSTLLTITIAGDVNGDFTVDIYDAIILAGSFNTHWGNLHWNANADINGDGIVDIYDAIILAGHFNQHYP